MAITAKEIFNKLLPKFERIDKLIPVHKQWLNFIKEFNYNPKTQKWTHSSKDWWMGIPGDYDINREIANPGAIDLYPDGAIGYRWDENFWLVGVLPLWCIDVPIEWISDKFWNGVEVYLQPDVYYDPESELPEFYNE